jgi:hypothetical protein
MKKILWMVLILILGVPRMLPADPPAPGKNPPDWVLEHQKEHGQGKHLKRTRPPRNIAGTVQKNAKQVSPSPAQGSHIKNAPGNPKPVPTH